MQILSGKLTAKQGFISVIRLGRALTKTFLHIPLMGANPIGFAPISGKTRKTQGYTVAEVSPQF
uniref:hypothetical protein n=1 Tax=Prevotella sp. TaxID=59823 RepID=UPI004028532E